MLVGFVAKYIGLLPVSDPPSFEISPDELATLDLVLEDIIRQDTIPVALLESIVGQYTHVALLWRASLSVPHAVYTYIHAVDRNAMFWKSVKQKLCLMRGLLPLIHLRINCHVLPLVLTQDAAGPSSGASNSTGAFCFAVGVLDAGEIS